jgi:hypothetical protein
MSLYKEKIEKFWYEDKLISVKSGLHKWMKRQMNKFMRRKPILEDEVGYKSNRKPTKGWEL